MRSLQTSLSARLLADGLVGGHGDTPARREVAVCGYRHIGPQASALRLRAIHYESHKAKTSASQSAPQARWI